MGKGGKITYTYNDYHSRITNPGYARTAHGTFFVRWLEIINFTIKFYIKSFFFNI